MRKTDLFYRPSSLKTISIPRKGYLCCSDALDFLSHLRDGVADIVFVDPPFNLGKDYGISHCIEHESSWAYELYMSKILFECVRVLAPGGAIFLYHIPQWACRFASLLLQNLVFRHWIAISMKNGFVRGDHLYPAHYALLYFTKGSPAHFQRPRVPVRTCRHCEKELKDYGGYLGIVRQKGLNLSDFWDDLSPVRHRHTKLREANQLPSTLTDRVISIAGFPAGLLVDPFAGTGTSLLSAAKQEMRFVGNDISLEAVELCLRRLTQEASFGTDPLPQKPSHIDSRLSNRNGDDKGGALST